MKKVVIVISFLISLKVLSQDKKAIQWINKNAIEIEDTDAYIPLESFVNMAPEKFNKAKIFGFGEATHHGKEFFDLKSKFFKFLVKHRGVKTFIIEDSYPAEAGINEWISGGKGNFETIAENFGQPLLRNKEVVGLLQWMRDYNRGQSKDEQIKFYGMDVQNPNGIDIELRTLIQEFSIPIPEELIFAVDTCVRKKVIYMDKTDWAEIQIPKLEKLTKLIVSFQNRTNNKNNPKFNKAIRALENLKNYTYYVQNNYTQDRDLKMFENVKYILKNESRNGKAFIWAHNEHINSRGFTNYNRRGIYNLGWHLKNFYQDDYYNVGLDFGVGELIGYALNNKQKWQSKIYSIKEPFNRTYSETFYEAEKDIYFIEIPQSTDDNFTNFFEKKRKQLVLGGPGYDPEKNNLYVKKFSEMYDGFIFVKTLTIPNYDLGD